jgi:hypothetical protein
VKITALEGAILFLEATVYVIALLTVLVATLEYRQQHSHKSSLWNISNSNGTLSVGHEIFHKDCDKIIGAQKQHARSSSLITRTVLRYISRFRPV